MMSLNDIAGVYSCAKEKKRDDALACIRFHQRRHCDFRLDYCWINEDLAWRNEAIPSWIPYFKRYLNFFRGIASPCGISESLKPKLQPAVFAMTALIDLFPRVNVGSRRYLWLKSIRYSYEILLYVIVLFSCFPAFSQIKKPTPTSSTTKITTQPITRILFVLDASSSMLNPWEGKTKIDVARTIISEIADSLQLKQGVQTALRVYGHQSVNTANDCNDSKLEVSFSSGNAATIREMLKSIRPKGITPLALSLEKAALDFTADATARNIVLLVTDGEESCGGDPCAVSLKMQQQHVYLKPFIIGLNLDVSAKAAMECAGNYFNAQNPSSLRDIMKTVVDRVLSSAAVRINLLDADGNPLETDVNMTFSDATAGKIKYNFYHTLNYRGVPDTLQIDPVTIYDLVIHTIPIIERKQLEFSDQKNIAVSIPASQGFLKVELSSTTINNNLNSKIKCIIRKAGSEETVMVQDMNTTVKYLSGNYDLEVLTLPRLKISNVAVTQSSTTSVKIDVPGVVNISKTLPAFGAIFMNDNGRLVKIYSLNENLSNELVGLQAGEYTVIYRPKSSKKTTESLTKTFQIKSGSSAQLKL